LDDRHARLIEQAKRWTPYKRELRLQHFARAIERLIRPKATRRVLKGGCVLLSPARFKRQD